MDQGIRKIPLLEKESVKEWPMHVWRTAVESVCRQSREG